MRRCSRQRPLILREPAGGETTPQKEEKRSEGGVIGKPEETEDIVTRVLNDVPVAEEAVNFTDLDRPRSTFHSLL
jgi:hypothetical protein